MSPFSFRRRDRHHHPDAVAVAVAPPDMTLRDRSPIFSFDDPLRLESDNMIFDFDDMQPFESKSPFIWDSHPDFRMSHVPFPASPDSTSSQLDLGGTYLSPADRSFAPEALAGQQDMTPATPDFNDTTFYSHWLTDPDASTFVGASVPIPIPAHQALATPPPQQHQPQSFGAYNDSSVFPDVAAFSPLTAFAALQPLPRSYTPDEDAIMTDALRGDSTSALSPANTPYTPAWATQLWDSPSPQPQEVTVAAPPVSFPPPSEDDYATQRQRVATRRGLPTVTQIFQSSSAPSVSRMRAQSFSRPYSNRRESISEHDDATIRKKKRAGSEEEARPVEKRAESRPQRSTLRPPKLAPSAWQLYFTDWIAHHQASSDKKLNVAQAAKEAGQEYAKLTDAQKQPYKRRSQLAKEQRERELAAYMRTLTPEDIKRENAFRTAQRRAGKSRRGNIKDPNAPKKPLSAYFMFLQRIRSDPDLVKEVFGDETETTKQSVLAAGKWRSMTDEERKPFLAQAEQEKLEYEAARKMYEEGTTGYGTSINFSILPSTSIESMPFPRSVLRPRKQEPPSPGTESESDGFTTDDASDVPHRL
ncbi:uncharacterized protein LAESUDRAFT_736842 [Laetiporus sulphureus 93-53]|uniref:HMG box domain-containing protein n=1 Tax=Laetiporus sulphureus 93-53 TaxID=1314785 RepID=A0A165E7N4_9APHY|nr:uncharacterized protein LAESUDRAFT_736842 [Laetiporus sulphureus 93-53]KZT06397.1 hypothetical protein LAESUDRAFT_736842 [Laetiporus sulphureus 93-53]